MNSLQRLKRAAISAIKDLSCVTGSATGRIFNVYPYMFSPTQLIFLTECIEQTKEIPGCYVEAGCAYGHTTAFLNKFMKSKNVQKPYYAIDTFSGFVDDHLQHEIIFRGKHQEIGQYFSDNKQSWFDRSMAIAEITNVKSFKEDISNFNFSSLGQIAFCLLDVDIYLPMAAALPRIYDSVAKGGIIVVDDCEPGRWDGSLQAYREFVGKFGISERIVCGKLGVIQKPL